MTAAAGDRASRVQSVDRAMTLLQAVAGSAGTVDAATVQLARRCGINRATAWRILTTLEAHGIVARDPRAGTWSLGLAVLELASQARTDGLIAAAHPILERLSEVTGETADLAVVRPGGLTYVDEVTPPAVVTAKWLGRAVPLHGTSTGKALLAFLPAVEVDRLVPEELRAHTDSTITDPDSLRAELAVTRGRGYATCLGELESSLYGVSSPVLDRTGRPLAILSIWGPAMRVGPDRMPELGELAHRAAQDIARIHTDRLAAQP